MPSDVECLFVGFSDFGAVAPAAAIDTGVGGGDEEVADFCR